MKDTIHAAWIGDATNKTYITTNNTYITTNVRKVSVLKLDPKAKLPERAHRTDAGADLFSIDSHKILPGEALLVNTGLGIKIPEGYGGFIINRSSQRVKGITSLGAGLIDSDYRGPIKVFLVNDGNDEYVIEAGVTKIAQLVIMPVYICEFVDAWNDTERGTNGFGSTGK